MRSASGCSTRAWRSRPSGSCTRVDRLQPRAIGARLRCRLRRKLTQSNIEEFVGCARKRGSEVRRLEGGEVVFGHVHDDLGLALVRDRDDRLAFGDDLADFESHGRHNAALRCAQDRVVQSVAGELELVASPPLRRLATSARRCARARRRTR